MAKDSFTVYHSCYEDMKMLSDEELGRLFRAMLKYSIFGSICKLSGNEKFVFNGIITQMNKDNESYVKFCEKRRENSRKRWDTEKSGFDGGKKAKKPPKPKQPAKPSVPKEHYAQFVAMTKEEHEALSKKYGSKATDRMIEMLDNYKGQSGKNYASDYRAILNWVVGKYQQEQEQEQEKQYRKKPVIPVTVAKKDTDDDWLKFFEEGYAS